VRDCSFFPAPDDLPSSPTDASRLLLNLYMSGQGTPLDHPPKQRAPTATSMSSRASSPCRTPPPPSTPAPFARGAWPRKPGPPLATIVLALALVRSLPACESAACASGAGAEAAGPSLSLDALLARFRAIPGLFARYREEKHVALLAAPLVNEGTVHYAPPRRLARHALTPSPSSVVFDGTTLRFGDGRSEQRVDVGANPVVRAFVDSFLLVLAGDRAALERTFVVDFRAGDATHPGERWELSLVPRDPALLAILREVRFAGDGVVVAQMRIREASGDEGITTFHDVDAAHRYSAAEAALVFRIPPAH